MTARLLHRACIVWLLIILLESLSGTLRELFVKPLLGDLPARQLGVATGSLLILLLAWRSATWLNARSLRAQFAVGGLWLALTLAFELSLGLALGMNSERLLSDYDLTRGGLMGIGLLILLLAPAIGALLTRYCAAHTSSRRHRRSR